MSCAKANIHFVQNGRHFVSNPLQWGTYQRQGDLRLWAAIFSRTLRTRFYHLTSIQTFLSIEYSMIFIIRERSVGSASSHPSQGAKIQNLNFYILIYIWTSHCILLNCEKTALSKASRNLASKSEKQQRVHCTSLNHDFSPFLEKFSGESSSDWPAPLTPIQNVSACCYFYGSSAAVTCVRR